MLFRFTATYYRKNVFGESTHTEDTRNAATVEDARYALNKCLRAAVRDPLFAFRVDSFGASVAVAPYGVTGDLFMVTQSNGLSSDAPVVMTAAGVRAIVRKIAEQ